MFLTGNKVIIRTLKRSDLSKIVLWKNDPEIADLVRGSQMQTNLAVENRRFDKMATDGDTVRMAILTTDGKAIGMIVLTDIDKVNEKATLGMLIGDKGYWGRGYGKDAMVTLLDYLFEELKFNRINLEVFDYNTRAIKMYEKIGFKIEGTQRQGLLRKGEYHDIYLMGILKKEYLQLKP